MEGGTSIQWRASRWRASPYAIGVACGLQSMRLGIARISTPAGRVHAEDAISMRGYADDEVSRARASMPFPSTRGKVADLSHFVSRRVNPQHR
eukprot:scaffold325219_cov68-Tisochrysis_lutea.AAC.1